MGPATERGRGLVGHLLRIAVIVVVADLIMAYRFLPGAYDRLAVPLSLMVQVFGLVGLLLVPVGGLWLADQVRSGPVGARRDRASSRRVRLRTG
jgi:hypothetical protein